MAELREPTPEQIKEEKIYKEMGMKEEEYEYAVKQLGRLPNYTETGLFSVMWSEHCSYKSTKKLLKKFPTEGKQVLQGPGEGAGVVDIGDGEAAVFKMESHNSPTAVEPYEGAATGVGGIMRDVFSMGARPIALVNSLRFGELTTPRVRYLFEEAVAGIAGYGNRMGVPTIAGEVKFDPSYEKNPLVNAMCVGLLDHKDMKKGQASGVGNTVIYVGPPTGRDGIHGATFSSESLSDEDPSERPSIQAGDPFMEKIVMEACLEIAKTDALIGIQDMGAAGLTSSSAEMASKAGYGIEMNLDLVPQREEGMTPYEIMLSESQERMLLVVKKGREKEIKDICDRWGVTYSEIGHVTEDKNLRLLHKGKVVAEVPVDALAEDVPEYDLPTKEPAFYREQQAKELVHYKVENVLETLMQLLTQPTIASKEWVYSQYDYLAQANTVVSPGSDAGVIRIKGRNKALAMTADCNARYLHLDPEVGGKITVAEATRNIICSGGKPLGLTDCLNFGSPENPEVYWQLERSIEGMSEACRALDTPVIGGNVSLYNEKGDSAIYPTPIVGVVGLIEDVAHITTQFFKNEGDLIYVLGEAKPEFGGSELQKLLDGDISGRPPALDLKVEKERQHAVLQAIQSDVIASAHDISEGGFLVAVAKCLFDTNLGAEITIDGDVTTELFSETQSRYVLTIPADKKEAFEAIIPSAKNVGQVTGDGELIVQTTVGDTVISAEVKELESAWKGAIPCLVKSKA